MRKILVLNFGSTSTKIAVYTEEEQLLFREFHHASDEMGDSSSLKATAATRKGMILNYLKEQRVDLSEMDAVVGRGGLIRPVKGGTYRISEKMIEDLAGCVYGYHPCNLGGILAAEIARDLGKPAFTVDPPVIDELSDVARLSGHRDFPRRPLFHALNARAVAKRYASEHGSHYEALCLIVAHMGGGVTVSAHRNGRIVDVNNGLEGEGPFSAERPGALPVLPVVKAVYEGKFGASYESFRWFFAARCGLMSYLGTNDGRIVSLQVRKGDREAETVYRGMAYQIAKEIGAMSTVLCGRVDAVLLTGGFAHDKMFTGWIEEAVGFLAPVFIYAGENEMLALAQEALRVLRGEETALEY